MTASRLEGKGRCLGQAASQIWGSVLGMRARRETNELLCTLRVKFNLDKDNIEVFISELSSLSGLQLQLFLTTVCPV